MKKMQGKKFKKNKQADQKKQTVPKKSSSFPSYDDFDAAKSNFYRNKNNQHKN